jgi:ATP-binding cassette subfamily F protein 3
MGAIEALIKALQAFNDGILVISHDQYFIQSVCKEIWVVGDGTVKQFNGTFEDYKKMTLELSKKSLNNKIKL